MSRLVEAELLGSKGDSAKADTIVPVPAAVERLPEDARFRSLIDDTTAGFDRQRRAPARGGLANAEPSL